MLTLSVAGAGLLAAAPWLYGRWAADRIVAQQVEQHPDDERALVTLLAADPSLRPCVTHLHADHFVDRTAADLYARLMADVDVDPDRQWDASPPPAPPLAAADLDDDVAGTLDRLQADEQTAAHLRQVQAHAAGQIGKATRRWWWARHLPGDRVDPDLVRPNHLAAVMMASRIWGAALDRDALNGPSPIVRIDGDTLGRERVDVRARWMWTAGVAAGAGAVVSGLAATTVAVPTAWQVAIGLLLAVAVGALVFQGLVDVYTYYVDRATLRPATWVVVACTAAVAALSPGGVERAIAGVAGLVGVAVVLVPGVWLVGRAKQASPWGGGDTQVLPLALVVPAVLTGVVALPLWALMSSAVAALAIAAPRRWASRKDTAPPGVPMVPFLAAGWPVAWLLLTATGMRTWL